MNRAVDLRKKASPEVQLNLWTEQSVCQDYVAPVVLSKPSPAKPTKVYDTYWKFAAERQEVFFRKLQNTHGPWTNDAILTKYKFTNAYRASDRVSQYLIKNIIYEGKQKTQEVFFRIILFKTFNKIETWELLIKKLGAITYSEYNFDLYDKILSKNLEKRNPIYSAAYIMSSGRSVFGYSKKHRNHLRLIELMMKDEIPERVVELRSMQELFELLRSYPTIGDFLAYQYAIDINYSELTNFSEMEFIVPGPGAKDGIRKCFSDLGGLNEIDIIQMMVDRQNDEFDRLNISFKTLWGRHLQLVDCQNLFCEVGKYSRIAHPEIQGLSNRKRIKQMYVSKSESINYWYPPKWGINHLINSKIDSQ